VTDPPERRLFATTVQLRDVDVAGKGPFTHLEGRAVPYDTWADIGWFLEQHTKDSFEQSTSAGTGKGLPLLLFHDNRTWPIGLSESWTHPADGMHGVWRLNDLPEAQQAAQLARSGELGWMSIGFSPIRSAWEYVDDWNPDLGPEHKDRVTRLESRLLEVSLTPTPAFADAQVTLVRSAERRRTQSARRSELDAWKREVDRLRR
jgi:HK97 family phage prohead protease